MIKNAFFLFAIFPFCLNAQSYFANNVHIAGNVGAWGNANLAGTFKLANAAQVAHFGTTLTVASTSDISGQGDWVFQGSAAQFLEGGFDKSTGNGPILFDIVVNNSNHVQLNSSDTKIRSTLSFTTGQLILNGQDLVIGHNSSGTISNYNENSYIVTGTGVSGGTLFRESIGSSAVVFPIGSSSSSYTPASIANVGTTDTYGLRVFDNVYASATSGSTLTSGPGKTWSIVEAVSGGSNLSLQLQHNAADEGADFDNKHFVSQYIGTSPNGSVTTTDTISNTRWNLKKYAQMGGGSTSGTLTTGTAIANASVRSLSGITSVGYFTKRSYPSALRLPVELLFFQAQEKESDIVLTWATVAEHNNHFFEIHRSTDGHHFQKIGPSLPSKATNGQSHRLISYEFTDTNASDLPTLYYKLKQIDYNGKYAWFGPQVVHRDFAWPSIRIFPNPSKGGYFLVQSDTPLHIDCFNQKGEKITQWKVEKNQNVVHHGLPKGIYFLSFPKMRHKMPLKKLIIL